jgi:hypothetical protein
MYGDIYELPNLLSLQPYLVQILSPAHSAQTPLNCVFPLMSNIKFNAHTEPRENIFIVFSFVVFNVKFMSSVSFIMCYFIYTISDMHLCVFVSEEYICLSINESRYEAAFKYSHLTWKN